jgi:hypothetical protein
MGNDDRFVCPNPFPYNGTLAKIFLRTASSMKTILEFFCVRIKGANGYDQRKQLRTITKTGWICLGQSRRV